MPTRKLFLGSESGVSKKVKVVQKKQEGGSIFAKKRQSADQKIVPWNGREETSSLWKRVKKKTFCI